LAILLTVLLWYTASGYAFGIFCPLYWLSFFDIWLLVMPLVSFVHCIDYQRRTVNTMVKGYQRHNQKRFLKAGQSIKWPKDTKGITRSRISK
jgi:hypothetical protein